MKGRQQWANSLRGHGVREMVYNLIDWRFEYGAGTIAARPTLVNFV